MDAIDEEAAGATAAFVRWGHDCPRCAPPDEVPAAARTLYAETSAARGERPFSSVEPAPEE
jgi:hypothetical protein